MGSDGTVRRSRPARARVVVRLLAAATATVVLVGCVPPPPGSGSGAGTVPLPLRCAEGPVNLGESGILERIAPDGSAVVIGRRPDASATSFRYDLIDTRSGLTRTLIEQVGGDGAAVHFDARARVAVSVDHPQAPDGERTVRRHDLRSWSTSPTPARLSGWETIVAVSSDLRAAIVLDDWSEATYDRVDLATGVRTRMPSLTSDGWWNADYSPDATMVLQSSGSGTSRRVRVLSTSTAEVVVDFGQLVYESGAFAQLAFVDDDTVLMDGARRPEQTVGAVAGDEALLGTVSTGDTVRIDPGVSGATVEASNATGTRLVYRTPGPGAEIRTLIDGVHRSLGPNRPMRVQQDPVVLLTEEPDQTVQLHCL